jgi:hypothetical protein
MAQIKRDKVKNDKLIIALQDEKRRFQDNGHDTKYHELSIHYLRTDEINGDLDTYEILDSCVNDFGCVYSDYCL